VDHLGDGTALLGIPDVLSAAANQDILEFRSCTCNIREIARETIPGLGDEFPDSTGTRSRHRVSPRSGRCREAGGPISRLVAGCGFAKKSCPSRAWLPSNAKTGPEILLSTTRMGVTWPHGEMMVEADQLFSVPEHRNQRSPKTHRRGQAMRLVRQTTLMLTFTVGMVLLPACGSNQKCTPGQQNLCLCPDGKSGSQTCLDDGSGYSSCGPCCTNVEILCENTCQSCQAGSIPYCDSAQGLVCCPSNYPTFCDSQFAGTACGGQAGCYSKGTFSCASATACSGKCYVCSSGTYNCSTAKCQ
jgi:hypothetical protein